MPLGQWASRSIISHPKNNTSGNDTATSSPERRWRSDAGNSMANPAPGLITQNAPQGPDPILDADFLALGPRAAHVAHRPLKKSHARHAGQLMRQLQFDAKSALLQIRRDLLNQLAADHLVAGLRVSQRAARFPV